MAAHTILIIGTVWPEPGSSAAGSRMLQLIFVFRQQGWSITFASAAADSEFASDLEKMNVRKLKIIMNSSVFDQQLREIKPTIVMFDRFMTEEQYGWRVAENCPDALRILDTEDLHCLRAGRQVSWKEKREFVPDNLFTDIAKREIASVYRSDLSLIISSYEMKLLKEFFKVDDALLLYLPFMLKPAENETELTFSERKDFISIGNFLHEPNSNSVMYLKEEIWPLIRKQLPAATLRVYGAYPSQKITALHNPKEGFMIMGRAENAKAVIGQARVLLAPLRFGAGIKGKLIDAMQCGTPNVTTSIGAEGMHDGQEWNGLVADDATTFANNAVRLYSDKELWERSQMNGKKIIPELFSEEIHGKNLTDKIELLAADLHSHRKSNFTGAMLMQQTAAATKYMSKWIEEKNKQT
jgi:O-antigen biosynthesis protein